MARNWNNTANEFLDLGDITSARFPAAGSWTILAFFRIEDSATDDRSIVSKWALGQQFLLRTDAQTAPSNIEVYTGPTGNLRITGGNNVQLNTWYLVAVVNDGTDLILYLVDMTGTYQDDGLTGARGTDAASLVADIQIGGRSGSDAMDGDVAFAAYFSEAFSKSEVTEYLYSPLKVVARKTVTCEFALPVLGSSPEPDWSSNNRSVTINGGSASDNPPVALWFGLDTQGISVAGTTSINDQIINFMHGNNRTRLTLGPGGIYQPVGV